MFQAVLEESENAEESKSPGDISVDIEVSKIIFVKSIIKDKIIRFKSLL